MSDKKDDDPFKWWPKFRGTVIMVGSHGRFIDDEGVEHWHRTHFGPDGKVTLEETWCEKDPGDKPPWFNDSGSGGDK